MASCCDRNGLLDMFGADRADADARTYRRKGLDRDARPIVDFLVARGIAGATLLEIGGGIGAIQLELLRAGAARSRSVEISPAYEPVARELAREHGVDDRVDHSVADFAVDNADIPPADVVLMHKVVCCYPDMPALLRPAAERARRWLVLTFPADRWWIRAGLRLVNLGQAVFRSPYRAFFHDPGAMAAIAEEAGLRPALSQRGLIWHLLALERS